jgi:Domain of unknown function (DUF4388)
MSQISKRTRVRKLADSVWPRRTVNGYANLIAARLRKLADESSTGVLPVSGHGDGAIFFRDGQVVYAESSRTPPPASCMAGMAGLALTPREAPASPAAGYEGGAELVAVRSVTWLAGILEITELILDALTDLLSSESRYAKFRPAEALPPGAGQGRPISMEALLEEVQRRHDVLRQLAAVLTPDTAIACEPSIDLPSAQISPTQWALLARAGDGTTPRRLAMQLGRSVFGTTIEIYRLVDLGLLAVPGRPPLPADGQAAQGPATIMSFMRAVSGGRGSDG